MKIYMTDRQVLLEKWVSNQLGEQLNLEPIKGDASFRQYYRVLHKGATYIVVDAPPQTEDNEAFVALTLMLKRQNIMVPEVLSYQKDHGFMLLTDLGHTLMLELLNEETMAHWYQKAFHVLQQIQLCPLGTGYSLPYYDEGFIAQECQYFSEWCIDKLLGLKLTPVENRVLMHLYAQCQKIFKVQPQVLTHRDFHARNFMVLPSGELGLIDYQDAIIGPITYDLVSLLKDCYIKWPLDMRIDLTKQYYQIIKDEKVIDVSWETFLSWFDWVGLQRHIKVLGIFSRLKIRDNKKGYLADTPRILEYIKEVLPLYDGLGAFESLLYEKIIPQFNLVWQQEGITDIKEKPCAQ